MKTSKTASLLIIIINLIGVICLVYFAIPYLTHNTTIAHPNAMLPAEAWDEAGMMLTIGFFPLVIANVIGYIFIQLKNKCLKLLFFVPSILCLIIVASYFRSAL